VLRRVTADGQRIFARGIEVNLELDEAKYAGSGVFLFASILERFLGLYASLNSFTQTVARVRQREGVLKRWPPRAGEMTLV
jgi:type VI secretion system protein ImpG